LTGYATIITYHQSILSHSFHYRFHERPKTISFVSTENMLVEEKLKLYKLSTHLFGQQIRNHTAYTNNG